MPLPHTLPFTKPKKDIKTQKPHPGIFPSAPTIPISKLHSQKQKFLYGRPPPTHGLLQPHQISWLTFYLSLPLDTEILTTKIAALGPPLTRPMYSNKPNCLCEVHTWLELIWVEDLVAVVAQEIGPGFEKLREAPRELLSRPTKKYMKRLETYRPFFPIADPITRRAPEIRSGECKACTLSSLFQVPKAVRALEVVAKGRKKREGPYPEICAWLDPKPGEGWEARWKHQAKHVQRDRAKVHDWLKRGGWDNTTDMRFSNEVDMSREMRESNILGDGDGVMLPGVMSPVQRPMEFFPGERPVSFVPSFREMTPSPPGSPYGSTPESAYGSVSDWERETEPSSVGSVRNSSYTWEDELVDEYTFDPKRWCFDENATEGEMRANFETFGEDEDDSDDEVEERTTSGDREAESRAVSYANMIGGYGPNGKPNRAGEIQFGAFYAWNEDDEEQDTLVSEKKANEWAASYANLIGELPPTRTNSVMPQFDERGFF